MDSHSSALSDLHCQLQFSASVVCSKFVLNRSRLSMKNAKVTCVECAALMLDHAPHTVSEDDIAVYLSHIEASDGGSEILPSENEFN